ncbi:MAG: hypothetical protein II776_07930, partial [Clostridia bacterium]|nr:hypothetical protein [Clostridia bacterium]
MTDHRFFVRLNGKKQYGYGAYHAGFALFDSLWIKNETEYAFSDLSVRVRTEPNVLLQGDGKLDFIPAGGYRAMSCDFVRLDLSLLASLQKVLTLTVSVEFLTDEDKLLDVHEFSCALLPYGVFSGLEDMPETLAFFITPEQSEVARLAAGFPKEDLIGFARASYEFIKLRNINFVSEDYFNARPIRVRLPEEVLRENRANALELAILYASLAEKAGFSAVLYFTAKGKVCVSVTQGRKKPRVAGYVFAEDLSVSELLLIDGSYFGYGSELSFENAMQQSRNSLSFYDGKILYLDVAAARRMKIKPLPNRVEENGAFALSDETEEGG